MKFATLTFFVMCALGGAPPRPDPPPPKPAPPPRQPSVWQQIQPALNRSTGRIVDDTSYELGRLSYMRDQRMGLVRPLSEAERWRIDYERRLRIEERNRRLNLDSERARRAELDLREYELGLYSGLYAAGADEQALGAAKAARDAQLIEADNQRSEALRAAPENRAEIDAAHLQRVKQIRARYEKERARIFGLPPATQPVQ